MTNGPTTERRCTECGALLILLREVNEGLCDTCVWWRDEAYPTLETINQQTGAGLTVAQVRRAIEGEEREGTEAKGK